VASRIAIFRRKVALGDYELTTHAEEEMQQDDFTMQDVKAGVFSDRIVATQRHCRQPRKDLVHGRSLRKRGIGRVSRLTRTGTLRTITVFSL
jgi:hypothetical protein